MDEESDDDTVKQALRLKKLQRSVITLLILLACVILALIVGHNTSELEGEAAAWSAGSIAFVIQGYWQNRRYRWFWMTIATLTFIEILFVALVPWSPKHRVSKGDAFFFIPLLAATIGVVELGRRHFHGEEIADS